MSDKAVQDTPTQVSLGKTNNDREMFLAVGGKANEKRLLLIYNSNTKAPFCRATNLGPLDKKKDDFVDYEKMIALVPAAAITFNHCCILSKKDGDKIDLAIHFECEVLDIPFTDFKNAVNSL